MKVALVNVKYSPNLGDGLIAECLEWALGQRLSGASFASVDLAGRTGFDSASGAGRGRALAMLAKLPQPFRQMAVSAILRTLISARYTSIWSAQLETCDRVLLGGGQLLRDADLNFPIKIGAVASLARQRGLPSAVFGVGVSKDWSPGGERLFRRALSTLAPSYVAVRDAASVANWQSHFAEAGLPPARLCRDPGLLAAEVYPVPERPRRDRRLVGVGIVNPLTLNLHSHGAPVSDAQARSAWTAMIAALIASDLDVALFTNGPSDDERFLEEVLATAEPGAAQRVTRLPRPAIPADLVRNIAGCDALVAHRLHACITAFACKVAHVGLGWDAKLPAFFASVGRHDFVLGMLQDVPPACVADAVVKAIAQPVPAETYSTAIAETWAGIDACATALAEL